MHQPSLTFSSSWGFSWWLPSLRDASLWQTMELDRVREFTTVYLIISLLPVSTHHSKTLKRRPKTFCTNRLIIFHSIRFAYLLLLCNSVTDSVMIFSLFDRKLSRIIDSLPRSANIFVHVSSWKQHNLFLHIFKYHLKSTKWNISS